MAPRPGEAGLEMRTVHRYLASPRQLCMPARLAIAATFSACALAQSPSPLTNLRPLSKSQGRIGAQANLRASPPTSALAHSFIASYRPRELNNGRVFYSRIFINRTANTYLGYELILEPQEEEGAYLLTFGKLGITPLDVAATYSPRPPQSSSRRAIHLASNPGSPWAAIGARRANRHHRSPHRPGHWRQAVRRRPYRPAALHLCPARPHRAGRGARLPRHRRRFRNLRTAGDLEWKGAGRERSGVAARCAQLTPLVLLPGSRPLHSLAYPARQSRLPESGRSGGGRITFALDHDAVKVESIRAIASGNGVYNLYVLHEPDWEPVSDRQKDYPLDGSIGVEEIPNPVRK